MLWGGGASPCVAVQQQETECTSSSNCLSAPDVTAMPIAGPLTAAMIGFGKWMYDWNVLHSVTVCRYHVQAISLLPRRSLNVPLVSDLD